MATILASWHLLVFNIWGSLDPLDKFTRTTCQICSAQSIFQLATMFGDEAHDGFDRLACLHLKHAKISALHSRFYEFLLGMWEILLVALWSWEIIEFMINFFRMILQNSFTPLKINMQGSPLRQGYELLKPLVLNWPFNSGHRIDILMLFGSDYVNYGIIEMINTYHWGGLVGANVDTWLPK